MENCHSRTRYTIPLVPSSLNKFAGRQNVWEYRSLKQHWAELVIWHCLPRPEKPIERAIVTLTYHFADKRRRDPDNYAGKMILDGLVQAGILRDDSFGHIELRLRQGEPDRRNQRTVIEIEATE